MGTALAAAEVNEVMLFARGAAALAAAAAAMERRWATISAGDRDLSCLLSSCFNFSSACIRLQVSTAAKEGIPSVRQWHSQCSKTLDAKGQNAFLHSDPAMQY